MLFSLFSQYARDPQALVIVLVAYLLALVIGFTCHEFSHAYMAFRLGDSTAARLGRVSLDPRAHLDPMGTMFLLIAGFGWGKPVPYDPGMLRPGLKPGMALVAFAGPFANMLVAAIFALPLRLQLFQGVGLRDFSNPLFVLAFTFLIIVQINILLAVFNLIPIFPLDGFTVLMGILPDEIGRAIARILGNPNGLFILIIIFAVDMFFRVGLLSAILGPGLNLLNSIILGQ